MTDGRSPSPWGGRVPETVCDRAGACLGEKLRQRLWDLVVDFPVFDAGDAAGIVESAGWIRHYVFPSSDDVYMVCNRSALARGPGGGILEGSAVRPSNATARALLNQWDAYGDGKKRLEEVFAASSLNFTALRLCR
ncbi:unnamed protein product [Prorocentrum cordatum]|uniref:Cyanocobalamin reductase (cyanide-eliminating) n=1 Tax=Prorocentrum cordatum TaxID=2364126 RepID=A0ABN9WZY9_9DINO|nr:unnamed protein product [Polarella glacialis]